MPKNVFVSYAGADTEYVARLARHLESGGLSVWFGGERLEIGDDWARSVVAAIDECAAFIVVMSSDSSRSSWVRREVNRALWSHRPILPLLLEGAPFFQLNERHYEDVRDRALPSPAFLAGLTRTVQRSQSDSRPEPRAPVDRPGRPTTSTVPHLVRTLPSSSYEIVSLAWQVAPRGEPALLATADGDLAISVYSCERGSLLTKLHEQGSAERVELMVAQHPDIANRFDTEEIRLLVMADPVVENGEVDIAWSPDGEEIASTGGQDLGSSMLGGVWDLRAARLVRNILIPEIPEIPEARRRAPRPTLVWGAGPGLVAGYGDRLWDGRTGRTLVRLPRLDSGISGLWLSPGGSTLLVLSGPDDIRLIRCADWTELASWRSGSSTRVVDATWASDESRFALARPDGEVAMWDTRGRLLSRFHHQRVRSVSWQPNGHSIIAQGDQRVVSWNVLDAAFEYELPPPQQHFGYWNDVCGWAPDGRTYAVTRGVIEIWRLAG